MGFFTLTPTETAWGFALAPDSSHDYLIAWRPERVTFTSTADAPR